MMLLQPPKSGAAEGTRELAAWLQLDCDPPVKIIHASKAAGIRIYPRVLGRSCAYKLTRSIHLMLKSTS